MEIVDYSTIKQDLEGTVKQFCNEHAPILIVGNQNPSVVMMSYTDYKSLEETAYLLRSPKNAQRLIESLIELESGNGQERELLE